MAYDEQLANRVREVLFEKQLFVEKQMMGGLVFMVNGKMCVGIVKDDLMVRINPELYEASLSMKGCRPMDFTGKPMKGYVFIEPDGLTKVSELEYWIKLALDYNVIAKASDPSKKKKK